MQSISLAIGLAVLVSFGVAVLLLATRHRHARFSLDSQLGPQKFHFEPTPRIGGIAVACGLVAGLCASGGGLLLPLALCALPAFAAGLLEDLTKTVSIRARLAATALSALLVSVLTGAAIHRLDIPGVDTMLALVPAAVLVTAFCVTGVANAFNIIDGFNGLASGVVLICTGALSLLAAQAGDQQLVLACAVVMAATLGFAPLNFPGGRIFLGDGGAFLLGFLVAWLAVLLPMRNPGISPWASLLACGYPILETLFSIYRKQRRDGYHAGMPDRVHLHMLLHRRLARKLFPRRSRVLQNSLTSPFAWGCALAPALLALAFPRSTGALVVGFLLCATLYTALYLRLTQFRWCIAPTLRSEGQMAEGT